VSSFRAQHSVQPTGGIRRDLWALSALEGNPALGVLSRPTHQRLTRAVGLIR